MKKDKKKLFVAGHHLKQIQPFMELSTCTSWNFNASRADRIVLYSLKNEREENLAMIGPDLNGLFAADGLKHVLQSDQKSEN